MNPAVEEIGQLEAENDRLKQEIQELEGLLDKEINNNEKVSRILGKTILFLKVILFAWGATIAGWVITLCQ